MHLMRVLNGTCLLGIFLGGMKGFHTQRLETAKGLTCFGARKAPASCTGSLQWRLKAALATRIPTEPTRTGQLSCCSSLPIFIVPLPEYASAASRSSGPLSAGYGKFQGRNALGVYRRRSQTGSITACSRSRVDIATHFQNGKLAVPPTAPPLTLQPMSGGAGYLY